MTCSSDADMDDWLWASSQLHVSWMDALANKALLASMGAHLTKNGDQQMRLTFIRGGSPIRCKPLQAVFPQKSISLADLCVMVRRADREHALVDWRFMLLKAHDDKEITPTMVRHDTFFYQHLPPFTLNTGILGIRKQATVYDLAVNRCGESARAAGPQFFLGFIKFKSVKDYRKNKSNNDLLVVVDPASQNAQSYSFHTILNKLICPSNQEPISVGLNILDLEKTIGWTTLIRKLWSAAGFQVCHNHEIKIGKPTQSWIDYLISYQSIFDDPDPDFISQSTAGFDASIFPRDLMEMTNPVWNDDRSCNVPNNATKTGMNWLVLDVHST